MEKYSLMDLYSQIRPLIFLPFNIWFFFASLPFRFLYSLYSSFWKHDSSAFEQVKDRAMELKEDVIYPTLKPAPVHKAHVVPESERLHGWFAVEKEESKKEQRQHLKQSKEQPRRRPIQHSEDERLHGWFAVDKQEQLPKDQIKESKEELPLKTQHSEDERLHGWFSADKEAQLPKQQTKEVLPMKTQHSEDDRLHGWFSVGNVESKKEQIKEEAPLKIHKKETRDESAELRDQLAQIEERERITFQEKQRLERQFDDLTNKYNNDEQALASFEQEKQRFRNLIHVEQKKCFDFQQQIISLKGQLKSEHESKIEVEEQLNALKKQKNDKRKASKARKSTRSDVSSSDVGKESATPFLETAQPSEEPSAWHLTPQKTFTEMVAEAQREELEHGKSFSEVVKESVRKEEPVVADSKPEFVVIGGDLSTKHIVSC